MRVLWFTNTPSLSADYLNNKSVGGGWIASLETELRKIPSIQLGISFNLNDRDVKPFAVDNTKYFPVKLKSHENKLKKLVSRWKKPVQNENNIQTYLDVIKEFKPDLINIFGTEGAFGLIISKIDIPCVIHLQGNVTIYNHKWYSGLTAIDVLKYSNKRLLIKGQGTFHDYLLSKKIENRERYIFCECKYLMGRTDWDRRFSSVLSPQSKYFHCDEIMRPEFYLHQWLPQNNKINYNIITTIRGNIYKGLETILECKKILNEINLGFKTIWKIAGINKKDEIPNLLERKYRSSFKEQGIQLLGSLQEEELIREMLCADVFIHPSHIDNSPNSVCEAMLLGMPVIATFAGGIPSIVENKKDGLLVQDGDPYALAGAIIELKKDRNYATELGINAKARAMIRHNPERIVNELLTIYASILS